jgi:thymidylate synthase
MTPFVLNTRLTPTDDAYHNLVEDVLHNGNFKGDRTGTGTHAVVGRMARYSLLNKRSPRLTTKGMQDTAEREMLWFTSGSSSIKELRDQKIGIWNSWLIPGTAKYHIRDLDELVHLITRKFDGDEGTVNLTTPDNFAKLPEGKGINTYGKCIVKITLKESLKKTVAVYGSTEDFASVEAVINYIAIELGIALRVLTDGDIGPGGYGPQWRHWQDTQIVPQSALHDYHQQGYTVRGEIAPVGVPDTEEAMLAQLEFVAAARGYVRTDVVKVQFDEVGDKGYDVYNNGGTLWARYHDEEGLRKIFTVIADLPRFVVYREIDQLVNAIQILKHEPNSRRIIVTAWNPALTWKAALPPCHLYFQFISHELTLEQRIMIAQDQVELAKYDLEKKQRQTGTMDCALRTWTDWTVYQKQTLVSDEEMHRRLDEAGIKRRGLYCFLLLRSNDLGLGQPFNVAQYATLTHMVAQCVDMEPLELVWAAVDAHVYTNHVAAIEHQLTLESKDCIPRLKLNPEVKSIDGFKISDIEIIDYDSHPALTKEMPVAV